MPKILVIDDSPTIASTVQWVLRDYSHQVHVERDGLSALNALKEFEPDLILLDIRLPCVDGFQLCQLIRSDPQYDSVPIVILSGLSHADHIRRAREVGANDYITKPIRDDVLIHSITTQLERSQVPTNRLDSQTY